MRIEFAAVCGAALLSAACHVVKDSPPTEPLDVAAEVTVTPDGAGGFVFRYDAPYADENGNFDFTKGEAYGRVIALTFTIADGSVAGLKFKPMGADAMWIVEKAKLEDADDSPSGPYRGNVFHDFAVGADGLTLTVIDDNNDRTVYRYALRFDLGAETVVDDPDVGNDGHG